MARIRPIGEFVLALGGPIIWFAHFSTVYLVEAWICTASRPSDALMRGTLIVLTLAALASISAIAFFRRRYLTDWSIGAEDEQADFLPRIQVVLALLSALGLIWVSVPSLLLPVCAFSPG